jgi:hypothetical protein
MQPAAGPRNAGVACAAVLFEEQPFEPAKPRVEFGHNHAALALSALRSVTISSEQDLMTALMLGVAMVTFALHVADGQPYLIARYTLSLINTEYVKMSALSALDASITDLFMCLVSTEIFECLLRSHRPTMRVYIRGDDRVDRYLGLSSPLFPYFHEICEISCSIRHARLVDLGILQRLRAVQAALDQWYPSTPVDFAKRYTRGEILTILAQSKVLRLAALLIIHRLYYPYGEDDQKAILLSRAIIGEFELVLQISQRSIPCADLAYLIASFELSGEERTSAIERSHRVITFSDQLLLRFKTTSSLVWKARDQGCTFYWFELSKYAKFSG